MGDARSPFSCGQVEEADLLVVEEADLLVVEEADFPFLISDFSFVIAGKRWAALNFHLARLVRGLTGREGWLAPALSVGAIQL
jgi:hypothetical protein